MSPRLRSFTAPRDAGVGIVTAMEVALVPAPDSGDRENGTARPGIPLNGPAVEARAAVRGTLASWADLMVAGRTVRLPLRTVPALAASA